ncbi:SpoIIE family protein phosphatase [Streptomyces sp. HPF1205]|uniref:ATP-binding SpoIIE family protein phosphatase n=1 Tax=Streptomyces sp. HPF1205 TaxID=2873262 RepID=UPI001CEC3F9E|nr:SpoIIE family protein phosphatase [Streptomyces sp. HPF1205]
MVGKAGDAPAPGDRTDTAELRQIEALNRIGPDGRSAAGEGRPDAAAGPDDRGDPGTDTGGAGPDPPVSASPASAPGGSAASSSNAGPGQDPARGRETLLLETGHALAEADRLGDGLRALRRLSTPDFPLDGLVVFGVTEKFLNVLGQSGYRRGGAEQVFRMPVTARFPATEVLGTGRPVFLSSAAQYKRRFAATWPLAERHGRAAWAFLPLVTAGRLTGVLMAAFRTPMRFTADERGLLVEVARLVAQALERTRTSTAELALSRGLRRSMGSAPPEEPGLSVATRYVPTGGGLVVGGDWYDVINLPGGRLALVIGDVQGHDVHAAGLMAQLRTAVHAYAAEGHGPDAVLARASRFLTALDEDRFATCLYIEAEPAAGMLHIARAGHPHPVLRLPDGTCVIRHVRGGLPLGLMPEEHDYPVTDLELRFGEIMMLCTDGLIETGGHDMFSGWVRVRDTMTPGPADDLEGMADRLIRTVQAPGAASGREDRTAGRVPPELDARGPLSPRNEDDIALLLLRRDIGVPAPAVPERRLMLTIEQDQGQGLAEARAELQALLHDWAQPDQVDTAVLLASELVGNVLMHTDQTAVLCASVHGEPGRRELVVEVTDRGDELPHQRTPGELASSGRGLMLLDILSGEWSVRPESEGKTVWFRLQENGSGGERADHAGNAGNGDGGGPPAAR